MGATLCCGAWASHCSGFSLRSVGSRPVGFGSCGTWASVVVAHGLSSYGLRAPESRLSNCGARA